MSMNSFLNENNSHNTHPNVSNYLATPITSRFSSSLSAEYGRSHLTGGGVLAGLGLRQCIGVPSPGMLSDAHQTGADIRESDLQDRDTWKTDLLSTPSHNNEDDGGKSCAEDVANSVLSEWTPMCNSKLSVNFNTHEEPEVIPFNFQNSSPKWHKKQSTDALNSSMPNFSPRGSSDNSSSSSNLKTSFPPGLYAPQAVDQFDFHSGKAYASHYGRQQNFSNFDSSINLQKDLPSSLYGDYYDGEIHYREESNSYGSSTSGMSLDDSSIPSYPYDDSSSFELKRLKNSRSSQYASTAPNPWHHRYLPENEQFHPLSSPTRTLSRTVPSSPSRASFIPQTHSEPPSRNEISTSTGMENIGFRPNSHQQPYFGGFRNADSYSTTQRPYKGASYNNPNLTSKAQHVTSKMRQKLVPNTLATSADTINFMNNNTTNATSSPMLAMKPKNVASANSTSPPVMTLISGESPTSKARFKQVYKELWNRSKDDNEDQVLCYGEEALTSPENQSIRWKIAMELADICKRSNRMSRARRYYRLVNTIAPLAWQGWLEHAKMQEECGELVECKRLLYEGLTHCPESEALLVKAVKQTEKGGDLNGAREILARVKNVKVDKVWRVILEGALMEARAGQLLTARKVLKYLMANVSWYGPIWYEAARIEEKWQQWSRAIAIVEKGLETVPRYGPLWFFALHLYERVGTGAKDINLIDENWPNFTSNEAGSSLVKFSSLSSQFEDELSTSDSSSEGDKINTKAITNIDAARNLVKRAISSISSELIWKLHFEVAQMEERVEQFDMARDAYAAAVESAPPNVRWKIWLSGARMELLNNENDAGGEKADMLLQQALAEAPKKMKAVVLLEQSRLKEFTGDLEGAHAILEIARDECQGEWKVWLESVLVELRSGEYQQALEMARKSLEVHNGTGRLWAIYIQLCSEVINDHEAMKVFLAAIQEVPKSGEVWTEGARLALNPISTYFNLKIAYRALWFAISFTPQYGDSFIEFLRLECMIKGVDDINAFRKVQQMSRNAEPNYGAAWLRCNDQEGLTSGEMLERARVFITHELSYNHRLYEHAIVKSWYSAKTNESKVLKEASNRSSTPPTDEGSRDVSNELDIVQQTEDLINQDNKENDDSEEQLNKSKFAKIARESMKLAKNISLVQMLEDRKVTHNLYLDKAPTESKADQHGTVRFEATVQEMDKFKVNSISRLQFLYPRLAQLSRKDRFFALFHHADPITS